MWKLSRGCFWRFQVSFLQCRQQTIWNCSPFPHSSFWLLHKNVEVKKQMLVSCSWDPQISSHFSIPKHKKALETEDMVISYLQNVDIFTIVSTKKQYSRNMEFWFLQCCPNVGLQFYLPLTVNVRGLSIAGEWVPYKLWKILQQTYKNTKKKCKSEY
jgi:hypothetical protein